MPTQGGLGFRVQGLGLYFLKFKVYIRVWGLGFIGFTRFRNCFKA